MSNEKNPALEEISKRAGGMFGVADGIFAGHAMDEQRAKEFRKLASDNDVTLQEMMDVCLNYLKGKGFVQEHIDEQMSRIGKFFGTKLK